MNIQNDAYPYNAILFGYNNEWSTDTYYKMEAWKHYAKWKKRVTKEHILSDSKIQDKKISRNTISGLLSLGEGWEDCEMIAKGYRVPLR